MNFKITRTDTFVKTAKKFFKKHLQLISKFKTIIQELEKNPFEPGLKTHKLKGGLKDKYALSLDYNYRLIVTVQIHEKEVILWDFGTHDEVY